MFLLIEIVTTLGASSAWIFGRLIGTRANANTIGLLALVGSQLGQTLVSGRFSGPVLVTSVTSAALLAGYYDDVHAQTRRYLDGLTDADFDRVVDRRWDPPVTLAARLVSVIGDCLQHAGQASYVRGLAMRAGL